MSTNSIQVDHHQNPSEKKARIAAIIFALFLLVFVLYPFWSYTFPPPGQSGILVSFGEPDAGGNSSDKTVQNEKEVTASPGENENQQSPKFQEIDEKQSAKSQNKSTPIKNEVTEEKSPLVSAEKNSVNESKSETNQNQKSEEELKAAAEANKKVEYEKAKKQFGDFIGKGNAEGNNPGNQGDPAGDPDTNVLDGLSKGKGNIGGGLASRGLIFEPEINENSQKTGKVVVRVCINNIGEVIEAKYTQKGSTTTDSDLVKVAISGAQRYKFTKSPIEKQCGTITIEFKLK